MEFKNTVVRDVFEAYPPALKKCLLEVRDIIFNVAAQIELAGEIEETLKWGEPSYLTSATGSGSTIRISSVKNQPDKFGIYFNCQTTLIEDFRQLYPQEFEFDGNRALLFTVGQKLPLEPLKHCLALAQTYHLNKVSKKARGRKRGKKIR